MGKDAWAYRMMTTRWLRLWPIALLLVMLSGCHTAGRSCVGAKLFSAPGSRAARIAEREQMITCWDSWAKEHLKSGDILFAMGDARACFGMFPFSKISAAMAGSRFSHTGLISCEEGEVYIYDMDPGGLRRLPIAEYMLRDRLSAFAIKRVKPEHRHCIPQAVRYCQEAYARRPAFDMKFRLDSKEYYCTELTEKSYRSAGLILSEPVRVDELPRYRDFPIIAKLGQLFSSIKAHQRVFLPGNETTGIWSSPELELVCEAPDPCGDEKR